MWALFRSRRGRSRRPAVLNDPIVDGDDRVSDYVTDGVNLYRFIGSIAGRDGELVGIENCASLQIMLVPRHELRRGRFRAVPGVGERSGLTLQL
jgi:hypothetical protein